MKAIQRKRPILNWRNKLEDYVAKTQRQGDRKATQDNLRTYLAPWVEWIGDRGSLPTDQLIRQYLEKDDFRFSHTTYNKVGGVIVKFSNHYLEQE